MSICTPHKNVWCIDRIDHLGFLQDGDSYYSAFFEALPQAKKNIFITAWEMESKINLGKVSSFFPSDLRHFFSHLVDQNNNLKIKILCWKPGLYLKFSRERLTEWKWKQLGHPHLNFKNDRSPYAFGSFHEKLVVIDNACGFLGGMDVSVHRWDTADHEIKSQFKKREDGFYLPIHDAQFIFKGPLLEKMRIMMEAREDPSRVVIDQYPEHNIKISTPYLSLEDTIGSLSRTDPSLHVFEIEAIYVDAILAAKKFIYIENQYFTHPLIAKALAQKLKEDDGPEVIIVLPLNYIGSFERAIYINGRNKVQKTLEQANKFNRLGIFYPSLPNENHSNFLKVHSKIMIVDGEFITLGSANLNTRSMRVDREMNLNIEAANAKDKSFIGDILNSLLCEHLGIQEKMLDTKKGLLAIIGKYQNLYPRTLKNLGYGELSIKEKIMTAISPFVDMRKAIPKAIFWGVFLLFMISLLLSMKLAYDVL